ncbi:MAG: heparinase II/III family protein, partial [Anaerolineae bacterium]|nr:heparinase II/III family protein [Anaerolineae bacterium]
YEPPCHLTGCQFLIGHGHNDANGFYLYSNGSRLAPEAFGFDLDHASYHNTLLIDGQDQYHPPGNLQGQYPEYFVGSEAALAVSVAAPNHAYLLADATPRYNRTVQDLTRYARHVVFVQPGYFVMIDELAAGSSHQYEWVAHFEEGVSAEGRWLRGEGANGQLLGVNVVAPENFDVSFGTDLYPYARTRPAAAVDDTRLVHLLYPTDEAGWETRPEVTVLQNDADAVVLRVDHQDGSGRQDVIQVTLGFTGSTVRTQAFGSDARAIVVSREGDGTLRSVFMHSGSYLFDMEGDFQLVDHFTSEGVFEAVYNGQSLYLSGDVGPGVQIYAPRVQDVPVNGQEMAFIRDGNYIIQE